jgi:hypothetical protein
MDPKNKVGVTSNIRLGYGSDERYDGAIFFTK